MKRRIFTLASIALLFAFTSCEKPEPEPEPEPEPVTLTFSGDIVIDLGSTDADVLEFVTASDKSEVSVSGIDYDKVGEQEATFKTGDVTEKKAVKVKADKLAGTYYISWYNKDDQEMTGGEDPAWKIKLTIGSEYNQIKIPSTIYSGDHTFFPTLSELVVTFNGKDGASIPGFRGGFSFMTTPAEANFTFTEIEYGLVDGKYAIKSFKMEGEEPKYTDFFYKATFIKYKDE